MHCLTAYKSVRKVVESFKRDVQCHVTVMVCNYKFQTMTSLITNSIS